MKKFISSFLIGSTLFLGSNSLKADEYDAFGITYSGDSSIGNHIWGVNSKDGSKTLLTTKLFDDNGWSSGPSYVSAATGELMIRSGSGRYHAYSWKNNTWRDISNEDGWQQLFAKPTAFNENDNSVQIGNDDNDIDFVADGLNIDGAAVITKNTDGTIQIGTDENDIDITSEGIAIDGDPLITKKANGELHIGKNSWITKEENERQKVWAKDAAGNSIPIDYTNGTKLLINGRDVEQSINNVGALSAALTGLPTVPIDTTLACGLGTGTHGGDFAFSGGCASKVNEKLSINYAASMTMPGQDYAGDFEDTFSARAGFVWKLGKSIKPTQISMKAKEKMEAKIFSLEESNKAIISQNEDLKQKNQSIISQNKSLLARLERLEKIALGDSKSKDLATIKLP